MGIVVIYALQNVFQKIMKYIQTVLCNVWYETLNNTIMIFIGFFSYWVFDRNREDSGKSSSEEMRRQESVPETLDLGDTGLSCFPH